MSIESIQRDAEEFGRSARQGRGRLCLLVVRNVQMNPRGQKTEDAKVSEETSGKVGVKEFAKMAKVSPATVSRYYHTYRLAFESGKIKGLAKPEDLRPGEDSELENWSAELETEGQPNLEEKFRDLFDQFYKQARDKGTPRPSTPPTPPAPPSQDETGESDAKSQEGQQQPATVGGGSSDADSDVDDVFGDNSGYNGASLFDQLIEIDDGLRYHLGNLSRLTFSDTSDPDKVSEKLESIQKIGAEVTEEAKALAESLAESSTDTTE